MKTYLLFIITGFTTSVLAQVNPVGYDAQQNVNAAGKSSGSGMSVVREFDNRYEGLQGSPYLLAYWCNADITLTNNKVQTNIPAKYDVYSNRLVIRRPQGDSVIIASATVSGFLLKDVLTGQNRVFKQFSGMKTDEGKLKDEYLEVLHEGKTSLLIRYDKKVLKANYQGAYSSGRAFDELMDEKSYYLLKPDQTISKIKLTKKAILEQLNASEEVKKFVDQEKLDLKNEADVIRLLEYADK